MENMTTSTLNFHIKQKTAEWLVQLDGFKSWLTKNGWKSPKIRRNEHRVRHSKPTAHGAYSGCHVFLESKTLRRHSGSWPRTWALWSEKAFRRSPTASQAKREESRKAPSTPWEATSCASAGSGKDGDKRPCCYSRLPVKPFEAVTNWSKIFQCKGEVGKGACGKVFHGLCNISGTNWSKCALKRILDYDPRDDARSFPQGSESDAQVPAPIHCWDLFYRLRPNPHVRQFWVKPLRTTLPTLPIQKIRTSKVAVTNASLIAFRATIVKHLVSRDVWDAYKRNPQAMTAKIFPAPILHSSYGWQEKKVEVRKDRMMSSFNGFYVPPPNIKIRFFLMLVTMGSSSITWPHPVRPSNLSGGCPWKIMRNLECIFPVLLLEQSRSTRQ